MMGCVCPRCTVYYVYLLLQGGRTALWWASNKGREECLEALLQGGAEVDMQDNVSSTKAVRCMLR